LFFFVSDTLTEFISSQIILNIYNKVSFEIDSGMLRVFPINATMANFCIRTAYSEHIQQVLVLCLSCVPENVGVNQTGVNEKMIFA
jgi:hypothetical protein